MDNYKLQLCVKNGVNSLSVGVQTFQDHLLKEIGSVHTSMQVKHLLNMLNNLVFIISMSI